jgi:hypothetical protein
MQAERLLVPGFVAEVDGVIARRIPKRTTQRIGALI